MKIVKWLSRRFTDVAWLESRNRKVICPGNTWYNT